MTYRLADAIAESTVGSPHFPIAATVVLIVGFIAATLLGSIAWFNSKQPVGWKENAERPDFIPDLK